MKWDEKTIEGQAEAEDPAPSFVTTAIDDAVAGRPYASAPWVSPLFPRVLAGHVHQVGSVLCSPGKLGLETLGK